MKRDPKRIAEEFNDHINNQDLDGLTSLMTEDHTFIDRDGSSHGPKSKMVEGWKGFFSMFPGYKNRFQKIRAEGDRVYILGFAYWSEEEPFDPVIWSALITGDQISEWRVHEDTPENRDRFGF